MGYIAYIRQIYLDADHYKLVKDTYAKNPVGMTRPDYDRALEGVLDSPRILLPANRLVEIDRMLHLAADLKQPVIIYGGRETFRPEAAALLKKFNAPVLLSMSWPEAARDADPDEMESMRILETRDKAAQAPSVLVKAGVKFALYSDGLDAARDLQRAVKKALDNGLSREDALRALTLSPAEIYGVSNRLGSIEKGKIANLVVTRGDIFDDRTKVEMTLVDGRKYVPPPMPRLRRPRRDYRAGGEIIMKNFFCAALLAAAPLCAQTYVIKNATVMTVTKGTFKGSVLVKDGKIAEVGETVLEPAGAKVIDAAEPVCDPRHHRLPLAHRRRWRHQ